MKNSNSDGVSDRVANWISNYLNSSRVTCQNATSGGFSESSKFNLRNNGLFTLKAVQLKRIAHDICRTDIMKCTVGLPYVSTGDSRDTCLNFCKLAFEKIEASPNLWTYLDLLLQRSNERQLPSTFHSPPKPSQPLSTASSQIQLSGPTKISSQPRPIAPPSSSPDNIEYYKGTQCLNLVKYPEGIPRPLMDAMKRKSQYLGYPSKLRYEQVKIKREKQERGSESNTLQLDLPKTPLETNAVSLLRQMGFQDMQEIMSSLRNVQRLSPHLMQVEGLTDAVMMDIVTSREEKDEAKKMDAARIMSETTVHVRTEYDDSNSNDIIMYDWKEMLGIGTTESIAYPNSELLKSNKVKSLLYSILISSDEAQKLVKKLLNLEQKSSKWYGKKIPVAFFRYVLAKKIERWDYSTGITSSLQGWMLKDLMAKLQREISEMETAMYDLSQQVDGALGLKIPNIFMKAYKDAQKAGHLEDEACDVIVID